MVERVLDGATEVRLDGGSQTRDPLFIDDAVDAFLAAARLGESLNGRVVNLGGGQETSVQDLAQLTVELTGSKARVVCCPARARPTEMWRSFCDNAEAQEMTGWRPQTPLRAGLQKTIDYLVASLSRGLVTGS